MSSGTHERTASTFPDAALVERALGHVRAGTTQLAPAELVVPLAFYRDDEVLERERQMLTSTPLALVPSARLSAPNDFVVRDVLDTSVLVSRGPDGVARAFLNHCRHRGASVAQGCGSARRHSCPYHGWTYDGCGALVGIPGSAGFDGVDRDTHGLVELPSEERHGFVWVTLGADAAIDVASHLGPLDDELAGWHHEGFTFFAERQLDGQVGWKSALEAFAENYHFPYVHGRSLVGMNTMANTAVHDVYGPHHRICFPLAWTKEAVDEPGASREPLDNLAIIYWIHPNLVLAHTVVGVELIDILPADDPGRCTVLHGWMARTAPADDVERAGYAALYDAVHAALRDEDLAVLEGCGQGIRSGQLDHLVIGRNEVGVQHVVRTLADAIGFDLGQKSTPATSSPPR